MSKKPKIGDVWKFKISNIIKFYVVKIKCLFRHHEHEWSEYYLIKLSKHN